MKVFSSSGRIFMALASLRKRFLASPLFSSAVKKTHGCPVYGSLMPNHSSFPAAMHMKSDNSSRDFPKPESPTRLLTFMP
jgi:hypothetical protein